MTPCSLDPAFREAGFYRTLQPLRYGGLELDHGAQTAFARELGRARASSAWVGGILACHGWIAGMLPDEAQAEIWHDDPDVAIATSFLPVGVTVDRKGGGFRMSGMVVHVAVRTRAPYTIPLTPQPFEDPSWP